MRLLRAGQRVVRRLNCGVMWPDSKEGWCTDASVFARAAKTLRSRGAAAAQAFFLSAGGERRCIVQASSVTSFGAFGRVFVPAARTPVARTPARNGCVHSRCRCTRRRASHTAAVAPLVRWQAMNGSSFG